MDNGPEEDSCRPDHLDAESHALMEADLIKNQKYFLTVVNKVFSYTKHTALNCNALSKYIGLDQAIKSANVFKINKQAERYVLEDK